ncbi:MAG TPA: tetratricopeptide repeat protein, partial [Myxococcaceae bacterium]|nr:tetratricopeptide repeat protein [Myxococcaceae bacterium]
MLARLGRAPLSRFLARRDLAHARQLSGTSHPDEAASALRSALDRDPRLWEARDLLARLDLQHGNLEEAFLGFQSLTELEPDRPEGWRGLARVRLEAGQIEEALFALDRFLELEPAGTEARRERARLRERLGQHQGALLDARRLLEANPGDVQAWVLLVHSERMTRGDKAAAEASEAAIARVGRDPALIAELSTASATARPVPFGKLKEDFGDRADRWPGKLGPLMREVVSNMQRRDWAAAAALAAEAGRQHRGSWLGPWVQGV